MATRKATLVLSGGGAKGAFQVGAERVLREEFEYEWDRILGVSVGALNAVLLGQGEYDRLLEVWRTVREQDVYRKFGWAKVAFRLGIQKKLGIYDNRPLRQLIERNAAGRPFRVPVHVGRVSLTTGRYELVDDTAADFLEAVWQSATMPVIWEPIGGQAFVDGGLRNVTPLGDALKHEPDEIVVIVCRPPDFPAATYPRNLLDVTKRSLVDITIDEIMINDIREFKRINKLVEQAENKGFELVDEDGKPFRYCPIKVIEPGHSLGDTLDFEQATIRRRIEAGEAAARASVRPVAA